MGLIVDNFAGGGGASLGIEMALGRSPDIAVDQWFPDSYAFAPGATKTAQVRLIGNSVAPPIAAAIVRANVGDRVDERKVA